MPVVVPQEFLHSHIRAEDTEFYLSPDALQVSHIPTFTHLHKGLASTDQPIQPHTFTLEPLCCSNVLPCLIWWLAVGHDGGGGDTLAQEVGPALPWPAQRTYVPTTTYSEPRCHVTAGSLTV